MQNLKHVGRMVGTNKKVLVAYRTLPGDAYSCLVVPTESLDDQYHNAIINLVESPAAQEAYEFAEALDRTQFPDGSRMLPSLHVKRMLVKANTADVEMIPAPGVSILLSELNQIIAEQRGVPVDELSVKPGSNDTVEVKEVAKVQEIKEAPKEDVTRTTSASVNTDEQSAVEAKVDLSPEAQAKKFRSDADRLSKEAAELRRQAESLVPTKKKTKEPA
jgi:hypothetical protein